MHDHRRRRPLRCATAARRGVIAHISDPHLGREPRAGAQLAAAVQAIIALPQRPDAVLLAGDVADHATAAEHEQARTVLAALPMPVHVLAGNHDDRGALRAAFGAPGAGDEPIRYAVRCGQLRLVACDTTIPGRDDGRIDVDWLAGALAQDTATPTLVAMHHAPVTIGIAPIDATAPPADQRAALADLLRRSPQVRRVVAGHVHRTATTSTGGCPVLLLGSTQVALALDFAAAELVMVDEPPLLAVHRMVDGELVSHLQPVYSP